MTLSIISLTSAPCRQHLSHTSLASLLSPQLILYNIALWVCHGISSHLHHPFSLIQPRCFQHSLLILGSSCHLLFPSNLAFSQFSSRMFTSSHQQWTLFIFTSSSFFFFFLKNLFLCIVPVWACLGCYNKVSSTLQLINLSLTVLEGGSVGSGGWHDWIMVRAFLRVLLILRDGP